MIDVRLGDCLDVMPKLEAESVNLCFADPPYNIGIFAKMPPDEYLAWCEQWITEVDRVLTPNGAFWVIHKDPDILVELSHVITKRGRKRINWITWDKWNLENWKVDNGIKAGPLYGAMWKQICSEPRQSFGQAAEYLIYHADEGEWVSQCDRERGFIFEPLRAYLDGERERAGLSVQDVAEQWRIRTGNHRRTGMAGHWFSNVQWALPTQDNYLWLRETFCALNSSNEYLRREYEDLRREYEDLRREYEDLRREYEDLRYTFNNPGKVSSVWQIPPASKSWHPTPKPELLLKRVVETTSNPGDLVLDPFMGSGTTGIVCSKTERRFIGIEIESDYCVKAERCIAKAQAQPRLEGI